PWRRPAPSAERHAQRDQRSEYRSQEGRLIMLLPKRVKYRKTQRGKMRGNSKGGTYLAFGEYGIKSVDRGWLDSRQIEAARVAITRFAKRGGKVWIRVFPDKSVTKKPAET